MPDSRVPLTCDYSSWGFNAEPVRENGRGLRPHATQEAALRSALGLRCAPNVRQPRTSFENETFGYDVSAGGQQVILCGYSGTDIRRQTPNKRKVLLFRTC